MLRTRTATAHVAVDASGTYPADQFERQAELELSKDGSDTGDDRTVALVVSARRRTEVIDLIRDIGS